MSHEPVMWPSNRMYFFQMEKSDYTFKDLTDGAGELQYLYLYYWRTLKTAEFFSYTNGGEMMKT